MPINREDGRHWCDPASEIPDVDGRWECPDCHTLWACNLDGTWIQHAELPVLAMSEMTHALSHHPEMTDFPEEPAVPVPALADLEEDTDGR